MYSFHRRPAVSLTSTAKTAASRDVCMLGLQINRRSRIILFVILAVYRVSSSEGRNIASELASIVMEPSNHCLIQRALEITTHIYDRYTLDEAVEAPLSSLLPA